MFISVIVPFFNAEKYIEQCIEGILSQTYPSEGYEIIFADNNSRDSSRQIVERYPSIRLISVGKQGSYAARNAALKIAGGDIIAFTDPDCVPASDWLQQIANAMSKDQTGIVLGSHVQGKQKWLLSLLTEYANERNQYVFNSNIKELYYGYTNNMAIRRSLFSENGFFSERMRGSDTIFVQKCLQSLPPSSIMYRPEMSVQHLEIHGIFDLYRKFYIYGRSRKRYEHISSVRPLTNQERYSVFLSTTRKNQTSILSSALGFCVLSVGLLAWLLGAVNGNFFLEE